MKDLRYTTKEQVIKIVEKKNYINEITRSVISEIKPFINEGLVGTKLRTVSNNGFVKSFKGDKFAKLNGYSYGMYFDFLGYLYLRINSVVHGSNCREITLLKTDDKGIVTKVWDLNDVAEEYYNVQHQLDLVDKVADLQKEKEH